ncbi:MAG TPA: hypothetical protein VNR38_04735 [Ureibacillus sp.]|nr:hypothetical protein [Ureibacillus sp.]
MMLDYYSFNNKRIETGEFALSDEAFDLLSDAANVEAVRSMSVFREEGESSFNQFLNDLDDNQWSLYNISDFYIPTLDVNPLLENIVFLLTSSKRIWSIIFNFWMP